MSHRSMFKLDCHGIIPECGYKCDECISEMKSIFGKMPGVTDFYLESEGEGQFVVIEHDQQQVPGEKLVQILGLLPLRYKGFFRAILHGNHH